MANDMETQDISVKPDEKHLVAVTVDQVTKEVRKGKYTVAEFKGVVGVEASRELEQVINGQLTPLEDGDELHIKGGEIFVSHVRTGGAS